MVITKERERSDSQSRRPHHTSRPVVQVLYYKYAFCSSGSQSEARKFVMLVPTDADDRTLLVVGPRALWALHWLCSTLTVRLAAALAAARCLMLQIIMVLCHIWLFLRVVTVRLAEVSPGVCARAAPRRACFKAWRRLSPHLKA